jgi:hypothetical protein
LLMMCGMSHAVVEPKVMDMWGTCYFYFNCEGNPVGLGKTATECRAIGHSLLAAGNNKCYNL